MTQPTQLRAQRLKKLARVGDVLARVAEAAWAERRVEFDEKQNRLAVIQGYQGEYLQLSESKLAVASSVSTLQLYRNFSVWLTSVEENQSLELAQAQFMVDTAAEEVAQKRGFARGLDNIAHRAALKARIEKDKIDQQTLEELAGTARASLGLASELLSTVQQSSSQG